MSLSANLSHWIAAFIWFQCQLISFLVVFTMGLLVARRRLQKYRDAKGEEFSAQLTDQLCELVETGVERHPFFEFRNGTHRSAAQTVLLEQIKLLEGVEKQFLIEAYGAYGFRGEDLRLCGSKSPWRRLQGVTNLGYLNEDSLAPVFADLMSDEEGIVAIAAALSLSSLNHDLNGPDLLSRLPASLRERRDALYQVVSNSATLHGAGVLVKHVRNKNTDPALMIGCVKAFAQIRGGDSSRILSDLLSRPRRLRDDVAGEVLEALALIGDPDSCASVRPYLSHASPKLRARAAAFLTLMNDAKSLRKLHQLREDESVEVRRALGFVPDLKKEAA